MKRYTVQKIESDGSYSGSLLRKSVSYGQARVTASEADRINEGRYEFVITPVEEKNSRIRNIVMGVAVGFVVGLMVLAVPVSAEDQGCPQGYHADSTAPYGCMSDPQYTDGDMDILTEQAFTEGYLRGLQDGIEDPEQAKRDIIDMCGESGGVVAEDYSCIMHPETYYGPEPDDDVAGEMALPATH